MIKDFHSVLATKFPDYHPRTAQEIIAELDQGDREDQPEQSEDNAEEEEEVLITNEVLKSVDELMSIRPTEPLGKVLDTTLDSLVQSMGGTGVGAGTAAFSTAYDTASEDDEADDIQLNILKNKLEEGTLTLDDLTPELLKEFQAEVAQTPIERYVPWWQSKIDIPPSLPPPIKDICCAKGQPANKRCLFWLIKTLFVYTWLIRRYNGDILDGGTYEEVRATVEKLNPWLTSLELRVPEESLEQCCMCCAEILPPEGIWHVEVISNEIKSNIRCLRDVGELLKDPFFVGGALNDLLKVTKNKVMKIRVNYLWSFYSFHVRLRSLINPSSLELMVAQFPCIVDKLEFLILGTET